MKKIKIGLGRIYNANFCKIIGGKELKFKIYVGDIEVLASIGPNLKHLVMTSSSKLIPKESTEKPSRQLEQKFPPSHIFPADTYLELVASEFILVKDQLAENYENKDINSREEIFKIAEKRKEKLTVALDFASGYIGLHISKLLVNLLITEQMYIYRSDKKRPYSLSGNYKFNVIKGFELDINPEKISELKKQLPKLVTTLKLERASEILSWLVRAWSAEDIIVKFVCLFIPLECVTPPLKLKSTWKDNQKEILNIVSSKANQRLIKFMKELVEPNPPLYKRFYEWAKSLSLPGWERDVAAFNEFTKMRNKLLHVGKINVQLDVKIEPSDIHTLEDIVKRYVSISLFNMKSK